MGWPSFVSLQPEPFPYDKGQDATPEMKQSQPDKLYGASSALPAQQNGQSGYHNPFNLLVRGHTQQPVESVSFPTMSHLKQFIENMKRSFLVPGSDMSQHFGTAREKMKNLGKPTAYRSTPEKAGPAYGDSSENKDRFEQSANYQTPNKRLSFPDPVDSSAGLISSSVYNNQKFRPGTALYPHNHLAATGLASRNLAHGFHRGDDDVSASVQSGRYKQPEKTQFPSNFFFGHDSSYSNHVTAAPLYPPNNPSQDLGLYSSMTSSLTPYQKNILNPVYSSQSKDSLMGYQRPPTGFDFVTDNHRATQADVPSPKKLPYVNSYGKKHHPFMQHYWPKHKTRMGHHRSSYAQAHQPNENIHQPVSSGSVSLSLNDPIHEWSRGHMDHQTRSPQYPQIPVFKQKQMDRDHWMFVAKPSSFLRGLRRNDGYVRHQKTSDTPFARNAQEKDEKSNLYNQNLVYGVQKPNDSKFSGRNSLQSGLASNRIRKPMRSFLKPQRQTVRAGRLQPIIRPKMQMPPASLRRRPRNLPDWPSVQPRGLMSKCVIKRNTQSLPALESQNASPSSLNPYVKSKKRLTRAVSYLSRVCFTQQKVQARTAKDHWRLARRRLE